MRVQTTKISFASTFPITLKTLGNISRYYLERSAATRRQGLLSLNYLCINILLFLLSCPASAKPLLAGSCLLHWLLFYCQLFNFFNYFVLFTRSKGLITYQISIFIKEHICWITYYRKSLFKILSFFFWNKIMCPT